MKIAVGLSGGVDSSVAALLLKERGHEVVGVTMKLWSGAYRGGTRDACYGPGEAEDIDYRLSQEQLAGVLFPLGELTKGEVRQIAAAHGLAAADKADSLDFYSGEKDELIGAPPKAGEIVDLAGRVLGRHAGYWNFTVGQRKGLGAFGPDPLGGRALRRGAGAVRRLL